jgi:hypothetical protein
MAKCVICKIKFKPKYNSLQKTCDIPCAIVYAAELNVKTAEKRRKKERQETRKAKERLKTRGDWAREAQAAVNSYIRARDKGKPCVSCDKPDNGQHQRHASHFRSVGACSILRFNTFNIHASCATCNSTLSGNLLEYRIRLSKRLSPERVEWLECQNGLVKYEIDYLKRLKKIFNKRARLAKMR